MTYRVAVEKEDGSLMRKHRALRRLGLYMESPQKFVGEASTKKRIRNIRLFCARNRARFYFDDPAWTRSADYRRTFFRCFPPNHGKDYLCAYCGRPVNKMDITVDHIYPVAKVSASLRLQKKMRAKGIRSVNSIDNLAPACLRCNMRKGTKMGLWVVRGRIGKNESLWRWRKMFRAAAAAAAVFIAFGFYKGWFSVGYVLRYQIVRFLDMIIGF